MQFKVGHKTDIGRKRAQNQDSYSSRPELGFFQVSDGMGGHKGGETASATAVEVIPDFIQKSQIPKEWNPIQTLTQAFSAANEAIFEKSQNQIELQGMGTTTTALLFKDRTLTIGHVGDSRCYFFRPHALWQLTRDHSLVQEKLRAGLISRDELKTDRMKNVITRSVGFEKDLSVEIYQIEIQSGDLFMICSDGLSGLVEDPMLLQIIQTHLFEAGDIQKAVDELVAKANENGGDDNITCIAVQVLE